VPARLSSGCSRRLVALLELRTFGRSSRACPLRRSLSSQPNRNTANANTQRPRCANALNASQHTSSQTYALRKTPCIRMALPRRVGRIPAGFRRPSNGKHEGSRIVHPMIPDLAAAVRRFSAAQRTRPHVSRSDRTPSPSRAMRRSPRRPSHADGEIALRCRPRTPPSPQLGGRGSAHPDHRHARLEPSGFAAESRPHTCRIPTAIQWQTRRVTNRPSEDPGPCRRCAAALSSAADAPTYIIARIARQVRATHAPLAAKGRPMRTAKWRFAVAHGRHRAHSLAERQHPSRSSPARLEPSGFAAERRPHTCRIPTAIRWQHEESRIVNPMIPDLAVAARRLSAAQRTHPHIYRSDRTPGPDCACAARREGPSHADTEMALRCRPRTPPTPQLGAEAAPIQIIA